MKRGYNKANILSLESRLERAILLYQKQEEFMKEISKEVREITSELNTLKKGEGEEVLGFYWNDIFKLNRKNDITNE